MTSHEDLETLSIDQLIEEVIRLRELVFPLTELEALKVTFQLTPVRAKMLQLLLARVTVSAEQFQAAVPSNESLAVKCHVYYIRKALAKQGIDLPKLPPGRGSRGYWSLPKESKQAIREKMEKENGIHWKLGRHELPATS